MTKVKLTFSGEVFVNIILGSVEYEGLATLAECIEEDKQWIFMHPEEAFDIADDNETFTVTHEII